MFNSRRIFTALVALTASTTVDAWKKQRYWAWPSQAEMDLIFPLNQTYDTATEAVPIVFGVTKDKYIPYALPELNYTILDSVNTSHILDSGSFNPSTAGVYPSVKDQGVVPLSDQQLFYSFSNNLIGREGHFILNITVTRKICVNETDTSKKITAPFRQWNSTYAYFTIRKGTKLPFNLDTISATEPVLVNKNSNNTCLVGAPWSYKLNVEGFHNNPDKNSDACAVVSRKTTDVIVKNVRPCAVQLDDAAITSVAAAIHVVATEAASVAAAAASKSASIEAAENAGAPSFGGIHMGFGTFAAAWVVFVFSLSGWLFAGAL